MKRRAPAPPTPLRVAGAVALGTVGLVVWGMLFWGFLYAPVGTFGTLPPTSADALARVLTENDTPTGTYFFPWPRDTAEARARWERAHRAGPFFKLSYGREGVDPSSPGKLALGTLHNLVVSGMAAGLLLLAWPAAPGFARRFSLVFLAGSIGSVFIQLGDPVWFHMPWDYVRGALVYEVGAWTLLAGILSAQLRPRLAAQRRRRLAA